MSTKYPIESRQENVWIVNDVDNASAEARRVAQEMAKLAARLAAAAAREAKKKEEVDN